MQTLFKKGQCCKNQKTHLVIFDFGLAGKRVVKICNKHYGKDPYDEYIISDETIGDLE